MRLLVTVTVGLIVGGVGIAGCGGGSKKSDDPNAAAGKAALTYVEAIHRKDGAQMCALMGPKLRKATDDLVGLEPGSTCASVAAKDVEDFDVDLPEVRRARASSSTAEVEVAGAQNQSVVVTLALVGGQWKVEDLKGPPPP